MPAQQDLVEREVIGRDTERYLHDPFFAIARLILEIGPDTETDLDPVHRNQQPAFGAGLLIVEPALHRTVLAEDTVGEGALAPVKVRCLDNKLIVVDRLDLAELPDHFLGRPVVRPDVNDLNSVANRLEAPVDVEFYDLDTAAVVVRQSLDDRRTGRSLRDRDCPVCDDLGPGCSCHRWREVPPLVDSQPLDGSDGSARPAVHRDTPFVAPVLDRLERKPHILAIRESKTSSSLG